MGDPDYYIILFPVTSQQPEAIDLRINLIVNENSSKNGTLIYWPIAAGANVAELVDALDLGSSGVTRESSSLSFRTLQIHFTSSVD